MEYGFKPNDSSSRKFQLDLSNCEIIGNTVKYTLIDGSIIEYALDANREVKRKSRKESNDNSVKLTKYQLSVFDALKGRDNNANDFSKDDLKGLTEDEAKKLINDKLGEQNACEAKEVTIEKKSISVMFWDYVNREKKYLTINFKSNNLVKAGNFFRNLFKGDKTEKTEDTKSKKSSEPEDSIVVGNLEEQPILITEFEEKDSTELQTEKKRETREERPASRTDSAERQDSAKASLNTENKPDNKLSILGYSGMEINDNMLSEKHLKRKMFTDEELKIFNLINTNKEGREKRFLDETELKSFLQDLIDTDKQDYANEVKNTTYKKRNNGYLLPIEIQSFLEKKGLTAEVDVSTFVSFIEKIVNQSIIEDLVTNSKIETENLASIDEDNMLAIISGYGEEKGSSLVKNLCKTNDDNRTKTLNIVKDKLISFAEKCDVDYTSFETEFDSIVNNISGKRDKENIAALEVLVNNFSCKLKEKEDLYKANKNGIINMLANENICYSREDLSKVIDNIIKNANKYNPKKIYESMEINNPKQKELVESLLESKMLDYFPIFAASIISHETQFLEKGKGIFDSQGNGIMQITQSIADDIYTNSGKYDENFIKKIKSKYSDSTKFYAAIQNPKNTELHYEVGMVTLKKKINEAINFVVNNKYKILQISTPEQLLELGAMHYNGNDIKSQKILDPLYPESSEKVYVKYVYARDVISRFKHYTPAGIAEGEYYEYNPISKEWEYKSEISSKAC